MFTCFIQDVKVSAANINKIHSNKTLRDIYQESMKVYIDTVKSVKSKSLDELYTDEFRPSKTKSNITTVKSLKTGKPVETKLTALLYGGKDPENPSRLKYILQTLKDNKFLGSKIFGVTTKPNGTKTFGPGYIKSLENDEYAGTQIRLLQSVCEDAKRQGVKQIKSMALMPSLIFHTKMGFRPTRSFLMEIKTPEELKIAYDAFISVNPARVAMEYYTPILSKKGDKYYLDKNRTLYCAAMRANKRELAASGKRNLDLAGKIVDESVDMVLHGEQLNRWNERIKGFEITPDGGNLPKKLNIFQKVWDAIIH